MSTMKSVTVCVTSFNRFELLAQTINSFRALNTYPVERFVVIEDSARQEMRERILDTFGSSIELEFNETNIGQPRSIDKVYETITSEYVFHSEDDYLYSGNENFLSDSVSVLEERPDVHQVWIRHIENYLVSHGPEVLYGEDDVRFFEDDELLTAAKIHYRMLRRPHLGSWCGFSWNPGLRRMADYRRLFPQGYSLHVVPGEVGFETEYRCNTHAMAAGYRAALLVKGACQNMGHELSTFEYEPRN